MSDEEKLVTNFIHTGKHHEVALHQDDGMLHLLRDKQHKTTWTQGVAGAICGVMGYFSESRYQREMLIVLPKNRDSYCSECLNVLRKLRLSKYEIQGEIRDAPTDVSMRDKIVSINESIENHGRKKKGFKE